MRKGREAVPQLTKKDNHTCRHIWYLFVQKFWKTRNLRCCQYHYIKQARSMPPWAVSCLGKHYPSVLPWKVGRFYLFPVWFLLSCFFWSLAVKNRNLWTSFKNLQKPAVAQKKSLISGGQKSCCRKRLLYFTSHFAGISVQWSLIKSSTIFVR